jgi:RHS repeat-associated protein
MVCAIGGPRAVGDPVALSGGRIVETTTDITLPAWENSPESPISFERTYHSTDDDWAHAGTLGDATTPFVPTPFGGGEYKDYTMRWWHNWYSFVWVQSASDWFVRLPGGELVTFAACTIPAGQTACSSLPRAGSAEARASLVWSGTGFKYVAPSGSVLTFAAPHGSGPQQRFFLSSVDSKSVSYALPAGCGQIPGASSSGVPYISEITGPDGLRLVFSYANVAHLSVAHRTSLQQCVVQRVAFGRSAPTLRTAVEFTYTALGVTGAGLLGSAKSHIRPSLDSANQTATTTYRYGNDYLVYHGTETNDSSKAAVRHTQEAAPGLNGTLSTQSYISAGGVSLPEMSPRLTPVAASCPPLTSCNSMTPLRWTQAWSNRTLGNGLNALADQRTASTMVATASLTSRRTSGSSAGNTSGLNEPASPSGAVLFAYEFGNTANGPFNLKTSTARTDIVNSASAVPNSPHIAVTSQSVGRTSGSEAASETTSYTYTYISRVPVGTSAATMQVVAKEERPSVVPTAPATAKARVHYRYAPDGRVSAIIREGYTRTLPPNLAFWEAATDELRFVGTFFNESSNSTGKLVDVRGPCLVSSATATDCSGTFPRRRLQYASLIGGMNNAGKLVSIERFSTATDSLTTTYSNHNDQGFPGTETDENGIPTTLTYDLEGRPLTRTVAGKTWTYSYDRGHLTRIQRPEGDFDVICYRRLINGNVQTALQQGCSFAENPSDQPTMMLRYPAGATLSNPSGANWYEATIYLYGRDGQLRESSVYSPQSPTPFRRTTSERNPLGFTTFDSTGPIPSASNRERTTRQFASDGLVVAQASPYLGALDFCGSPGALDPACTTFKYWNTGRLKEMRVRPTAAVTNDISVCLDYDAHGNVRGVQPTCSTTGMHTYQWDDFGNVIEARAASSQFSTRMEYDGSNLMTKKVFNTSGAVRMTWSFDLLGRPLEQQENGTIVLQWRYDNRNLPSLPSLCTGLLSTNNQLGRLTMVADPVWSTWMSYDSEGNTIREARVSRSLDFGGSCVSGNLLHNQVLQRTFSPNGSISSLTYPSGRILSYTYDSTKRLSAIAMGVWANGQWSSSPRTMISGIAWNPGNTLSSYKVLTYSTLNAAPLETEVSYRYGTDAPTAPLPSNCQTITSSSGYGDSSGRVRAVNVARLGGSNVLQILYQWKGENVINTMRCYLGHPPTARETMDVAPELTYDRAGQLLGAGLPDYDLNSGYGHKRGYVYDLRGNRTLERVYYGFGTASLYDDLDYPDRLTSSVYFDGNSTNPVIGTQDYYGTPRPLYSGRNKRYYYDVAGRVQAIVGDFGFLSPFDYSGQFAVPTGSESVLRYTGTPSGFYSYFYDHLNRRVRKSRPEGNTDDFLWGAGKELLMELSTDGSTSHVLDEYIWLAGLPVVRLRGSISQTNGTWARSRNDWDTNCPLRGTDGNCRPYAIVSDVIGKPVLTFDSSRLISGVLEYDPFGRVNFGSHWADMRPQPQAWYGCVWLANWIKASHPLPSEARTYFPIMDISPGTGSRGYVSQWRSDSQGGNFVVAPSSADIGWWQSDFYMPWASVSNGDYLHIMYCASDTQAYTPQATGVTLGGFEYRRMESGTTHWIPPFRFPGQYQDSETGFYENWNRYYDPQTGRYLSPEPLLEEPRTVASRLQEARPMSVYSYASNNPLANVDPEGLLDSYSECIKKYPGNPEACGGRIGEPKPAGGGPPQRPLPPPVCDKKDEPEPDYCTPRYEKCVNEGGSNLPGNVHGETRCESCRRVCTVRGYWPYSIPSPGGAQRAGTWKCPGGG